MHEAQPEPAQAGRLFLGIDVAKHSHEAKLLDEGGVSLGDSFSFPNTNEGFNLLAHALAQRTQNPALVTVGMESTGHYWKHLGQFLIRNGYSVILINPIETQELQKTSVRKVKNDRTDAERIARLVQTKKHPVWVPSELQMKLQKLTRFEFRLSRQRAFLQEQIVNLIDMLCPELQAHFPQFFVSCTTLNILERWSDLRALDSVREKTFAEFLRKSSRGHITTEKARTILVDIRNSIAKDQRDDLSAAELRMLLKQYRLLEEQIEMVTAQAVEAARSHEAFAWINSIPGISPYITAVILAEIGDLERFTSSSQLTAFAGLDPSVKQSGQYTRKEGNHISKRGSKYLRKQLYYAARASIMFDSELKAWYRKKREQGKHYNVCACAITRKILCRVWTVWKQKRIYTERQITTN